MQSPIIIDYPVNVFKAPSTPFLARLVKAAPWLDKILMRLPDKAVKALYTDDYTVTERLMEKGFLFMNLGGLPAGSRLLDVGCVWSCLPLELASLGFKVWGIDIADYRLKHPNFTYVRGSACSMSFEDGFFDAVTAVSTVEHIGLGWYGDDPERDSDLKAMAEIRRVLKPGGRLILTLPYGVRMETKVFRVYDKDSLAALITGFNVLRAEYFINFNDKYWSLSDAAEAGKRGVNQRGRNEGNVCLVLQKI